MIRRALAVLAALVISTLPACKSDSPRGGASASASTTASAAPSPPPITVSIKSASVTRTFHVANGDPGGWRDQEGFYVEPADGQKFVVVTAAIQYNRCGDTEQSIARAVSGEERGAMPAGAAGKLAPVALPLGLLHVDDEAPRVAQAGGSDKAHFCARCDANIMMPCGPNGAASTEFTFVWVVATEGLANKRLAFEFRGVTVPLKL